MAQATDIDQELNNNISEPKDNEIKIREPFEFGGSSRVIYDIAIGQKIARTFGWKIHEGSLVTINGSGLGAFRGINLVVGQSKYPVTGFGISRDGRILTFTVPEEIAGTYENGTLFELEFLDSINSPKNIKYLKEKFRYELLEDQGPKKEITQTGYEQETMDSSAVQVRETKRPRLVNIANISKGAQNSSQSSNIKNFSDQEESFQSGGELKNSEVVKEQNEGEVFEDLSSEDRKKLEAYISQNPNIIPNNLLRQEVLASLNSSANDSLSVEALGALKTIKTMVVGGSVSRELKASLETKGASSVKVTGLAAVENGSVSESAKVSGSVLGQGNQTVINKTSPQLKQADTEAVIKFIQQQPSAISNSKAKQEVLAALGSGNISNLSSEGKKGLGGALGLAMSQKSPEQLLQAAKNISLAQNFTQLDENDNLKPQDAGLETGFKGGVGLGQIQQDETKQQKNNSDKEDLPEDRKSEFESKGKIIEPKNTKEPGLKVGLSDKSPKGSEILNRIKEKEATGSNTLLSKLGIGLNNSGLQPGLGSVDGVLTKKSLGSGLGGSLKIDNPVNLPVNVVGSNENNPEVSTQEAAQNKDNKNPIPEIETDNLEQEKLEQQELEEEDLEEEDEEFEQQELLNNPQQNPALMDEALNEAVRLINIEITILLDEVAVWLWALALPSFGLTVLLGAIGGDLILFFKNWLIKRALGIISSSPLPGSVKISDLKREDIARKVKIGRSVKINIFLMNLTVIVVIFILLFLLAALLKSICSPDVPGAASIASSISETCNAVNQAISTKSQ